MSRVRSSSMSQIASADLAQMGNETHGVTVPMCQGGTDCSKLCIDRGAQYKVRVPACCKMLVALITAGRVMHPNQVGHGTDDVAEQEHAEDHDADGDSLLLGAQLTSWMDQCRLRRSLGYMMRLMLQHGT